MAGYIKTEDQKPIKPEPDAGNGAPFMPMEDLLDESADLEFYDKFEDTADTYDRMYLTRLPSYLWEAWSKLDDDAEIEIGKIRQFQNKDGKMQLQMLLHNNIQPHQELPKEYNLDVHNFDVHNTFVFSEQDLGSYAAKNKERAKALAAGIPAHLLRQQQQKQSGESSDRGRRTGPYTRKAIPNLVLLTFVVCRKTRIAGRIKHEVLCTPAANPETERFLFSRTKKTQETKKNVKVYAAGTNPQGLSGDKEWAGYLKVTDKPSKAKKMENKTARWPENQLLDAIAECFGRHRFWSIKAFRNEIPQPEVYLRETLEKIAVLHRSGRFANHWQLRDEYQGMLKTAQPQDDAAAPAADIISDDEDEDMKMEDVL
ncbi:transcription initiation factor IIF, beta subunit-domain-containing protein [Apiosordaria backusii]|uniref:Transcription initiation factor IIF subunit beta n=1 Tax=Apiosordaria backusii TaxID=314023 RepID=A0AA40E4T2_9PEZI|nr:transcription initiation factor IIF, beta subunit-domain-containing protein [Apiosordaria backusii]